MSSRHQQIMSRGGSIDYDLYVINAQNKDTTSEQLRDCIYDALTRINERLNIIESWINKEGVMRAPTRALYEFEEEE